jgi:hypothetical protein
VQHQLERRSRAIVRPSDGMGPVINSVTITNDCEHTNTVVATVSFREDSPPLGPLRTAAGFEFGFNDLLTSSVVWLNATASMPPLSSSSSSSSPSPPPSSSSSSSSQASLLQLRLDYSANFKSCPVGVRYAWHVSPCFTEKCALYSTDGLPTPPFIASLGARHAGQHSAVPHTLLHPRGINMHETLDNSFLTPAAATEVRGSSGGGDVRAARTEPPSTSQLSKPLTHPAEDRVDDVSPKSPQLPPRLVRACCRCGSIREQTYSRGPT